MTDNVEQLREVINGATGPAPWYWQTFPSLTGASGRHFDWTYHGAEGDLAYLVTLNLRDEPSAPRLALNSYCRPFFIPPYYLGVWCPEGNDIRVECFYPDELRPFPFMEIAGWFKRSEERMYATTEPVAGLSFSSSLPEGTNEVKVPTQLRTLDELLMVGFYPRSEATQAAFAIYRLRPKEGTLTVLPQKWFTPEQFDIGRQWITRVTRDPVSQRLMGEALRAGSFVLTEDGCHLERWLEKVTHRRQAPPM